MQPDSENQPKKKERKLGDIGSVVSSTDQGTSDNVPKDESTANIGPSNPYGIQ